MCKQMDKYYLKLGDWTISKMNLANGSKYALYHGTTRHGFYDSADEAKAKYEEMNK